MKKIIMDHLGNVYPSMAAMCREYNIKPDTYTKRIKKGWSIQEALITGDTSRKECEDYLGNIYGSIGEMCNAYNITRAKYDHRIKAGWSIEDALTKPDAVYVPCTDHLGKEYSCVSEMCKSWGVSVAKYNHRLRKGMSQEEALTLPDLSSNIECQDHLGKKYSSRTEMCTAWGVNRHTFVDRMERGWSLEEALSGKKKKVIPKSKRCKDHQGIEYDTLADMCRAYGVEYKIYRRRRKLGWSLREALTEKDNPIKPNSRACTDHLGHEFVSIVEMCKYWHITSDLHKGRLRDGWTLEETLTIPRKYSLGEYRITVILNEYLDSKYMDFFFHDITIKKVFEYLEREEQYKEFLDEYEKALIENNITVSRQKIAKFRFDFSLIKNGNVFAFIEFDGEQHFKFVDLFFKAMEYFLARHDDDLKKNTFAEASRIPLLRIRYDQIENEKIRYMITDLLTHPDNYLVVHNTYLDNDEYMSAFIENTSNEFTKTVSFV